MGTIIFVALIIFFIIFSVILRFIKRCKTKFLEKKIKKINKQLNSLLFSDSEKDLINLIKKKKLKNDFYDSFFKTVLNYYETVIKKWDTEKIGRHLYYMNAKLSDYKQTTNCLKFALSCVFVNNVLISSKISVEEDENLFVKETKKFVFDSFIKNDFKDFIPHLTAKNYEDYQDSQVKSFLIKLREMIYLSNEEKMNKKISDVESLFLIN
jgi:ribosomal protein S20